MYLRSTSIVIVLALVVLSCTGSKKTETEQTSGEVEQWLTTGDRSALLKKSFIAFSEEQSKGDVITIDTTKTFQTMDGFGFALTGGSSQLIYKLDSSKRATLLRELFLRDENSIGINYLRISLGASDLDDHVFSYMPVANQKNDKDLKNFSLDEDRKHLIPVLKEILGLNPSIKIMASPWSAPPWMKTNNHVKGGSLKREHYPTYAQYFVRYIQEMDKEGIKIDAITLQNEPENPKNTPSMLMTAEEQSEFVRNHLGPAFTKNGIKTKIVVFDHNCDHPEYPITVLNDTAARKYIDGSAFHLYLGEVEALSKVYNAHPDKNIYFTEQWTSGEGEFDGDLQWHTKHLIIGAPRNWSKNVLEWNLAADPQFQPHTDDGGCTICQGALTIGEDIKRNVSYYIIAHASKFVPDGSVRVESNLIEGIPNVVYLTPEGKKVLIAVNDSEVEKSFVVKHKDAFKATLPVGAVATFVW